MTFSPYFRFRLLVFVITAFVIWNFYKFFWRLPFFQESDKSSTLTTSLAPIAVSVFYEALCPDSKNFIANQLLPTVLNAPKLINVTLVPYGKAKTEESFSGSLSFSCQHGPVECEANKIHACAIANIPDEVLLVKYISCMISDNMVPELIGEKCAKDLSIDWQPILHCFKSYVGDTLLKGHGQATDSVHPAMTFVPTVLLNGVSAAKHSDHARSGEQTRSIAFISDLHTFRNMGIKLLFSRDFSPKSALCSATCRLSAPLDSPPSDD